MTKQVTLRFPDELHEQVKVAAKRAHRSLQAQMLAYAERCLEQDQKETKQDD
jgi:predicted HicB family RNase H-like nuclease